MNVLPQFGFREAISDDEAAIRSVVFSVLAEYGLSPDPQGIDADLNDVVSNYGERGGFFRVVTSTEGNIVGCGGLYPLTEHDAEIRKMYLLPEARGQGIGRKLLEELITSAKERHFQRIVVETASVLREAISLYRQRGFVPFAHHHLAKRCDQAYVLHLASDAPRVG
jgi:putative acetyltransferase